MNIVTLLGRVGQTPETSYTQAGMAICKFSLATNKKVKGEDQTSWHRCVSFSKTAELIEKYVGKGDQLGIEGEIQYGSYEKDGITRYTTDIIVNRIHFVGGGKKQEQTQQPQNQGNYQGNQGGNQIPEDEIPF